MATITAIIRNGRLELPQPLNLPDGTEVKIQLPETTDSGTEDQPMTAEEMARTLAAMDKIEPFDMTDGERDALEADRQARKVWEKSQFAEHGDKLRGAWE
jgi:predicted DNA-binding antitoxin AbrB/MazE fold protein